jgi:hypothetical protein
LLQNPNWLDNLMKLSEIWNKKNNFNFQRIGYNIKD